MLYKCNTPLDHKEYTRDQGCAQDFKPRPETQDAQFRDRGKTKTLSILS